MRTALTCSLVAATIFSIGICLAQGDRPSTLSVVKTRQKFSKADMSVDLFGQKPVSNVNGVTIRQVTAKEMPSLGMLFPFQQVQHRLLDLQPCSANTPTVSPRFAVFSMGFSGKTSFGVIQNKQGKVLNTVQKDQATFFPMGMVYFEANLDCQPSRLFQVLSSTNAADIFPERQLVQASTDQIANQFDMTTQEAAAIKSAAQANAQGDPLSSLLDQFRKKCASGGGGGSGADPAPNSNNLQKFPGELGSKKAPAVTASGDKFQVEGNSLMNSLADALQRSCDVQKNQCADAANASGNKNGFTVSACDKQHGECGQFQNSQK